MRTILQIGFTIWFLSPLYCQSTINVPEDYASIQEALNEAKEGDSILVAPGTYFENIIWPGNNINLKSIAGPDQTIIDGGQTAKVINIQLAEYGLLEGFTIQNGLSVSKGAGIYIYNSDLNLKNLIIKNNNVIGGGEGGGAYLEGHSGKIESCHFIENSNNSFSPIAGVGLYLEPSEDIEITSCLFSNNQGTGNISKRGGGLYINGNHNNVFSLLVIIKDCIFLNNSVPGTTTGGGGISASGFSDELTIRIDSCEFVGNNAHEGGALRFEHDIRASISNSIFSQNTGVRGAVLYLNVQQGLFASVIQFISSSKFVENGNDFSEYVIYLRGNTDFNILNCEVSHNNAAFLFADMSHSIIKGGFEGENVIDLDPLFKSTVNLIPSQNSPALNEQEAIQTMAAMKLINK